MSNSVWPHRWKPAPLSLRFSRQEHWSGLPFPSPMHESENWKWSRSVVSDSSQRTLTLGYCQSKKLRPEVLDWEKIGKLSSLWGQEQLERYLLVFADPFIAWWEAFPCWSEKASEVEKSLLKERIPRFVFSVSIQSDSGGAFIATQVSGAWKLRWGCHETCNFFFDMCTLLYLFFTCFIFGHAGSSSLQAGFL